MPKNKEIAQTKPALTLNQIWGIYDTTYKQKTAEEYKDFLREQNSADLRIHCKEVGQPDFDDRAATIENLIKAFKKHKIENDCRPINY